MSNEYIGYLKYSGRLIENGYLDARKAAEALIGFDEALRFFVEKDLPELKGQSFEIPVRIQAGSWEALIPSTIGGWILTASGIIFTSYFTSAASTIAANDFKEKRIGDVFHDAIKILQWIIKINTHLKQKKLKTIKNVKWENNNETILLPDENEKYLKVPQNIFKKYENTPAKLLSKMAQLIQKNREMIIGVIENGNRDEVSIKLSEKYYFTDEESDLQEFLLPELVHEQTIELEGEITKGNEKTNSIGFEYRGHILTCLPNKGSIVIFKDTLFRKCKIYGMINRTNEEGLPNAKKPKIIFTDIKPVDSEKDNLKLF